MIKVYFIKFLGFQQNYKNLDSLNKYYLKYNTQLKLNGKEANIN